YIRRTHYFATNLRISFIIKQKSLSWAVIINTFIFLSHIKSSYFSVRTYFLLIMLNCSTPTYFTNFYVTGKIEFILLSPYILILLFFIFYYSISYNTIV